MDQHKSKWESLMNGRADKEEDYMKKRSERVEKYEKDLQDLRIKDSEEYNQLKIKLETDVQVCALKYLKSTSRLPASYAKQLYQANTDWHRLTRTHMDVCKTGYFHVLDRF